jgi:hypothetical protein
MFFAISSGSNIWSACFCQHRSRQQRSPVWGAIGSRHPRQFAHDLVRPSSEPGVLNLEALTVRLFKHIHVVLDVKHWNPKGQQISNGIFGCTIAGLLNVLECQVFDDGLQCSRLMFLRYKNVTVICQLTDRTASANRQPFRGNRRPCRSQPHNDERGTSLTELGRSIPSRVKCDPRAPSAKSGQSESISIGLLRRCARVHDRGRNARARTGRLALGEPDSDGVPEPDRRPARSR